MRLRELFTADAVKLDLEADSKDDLLKELVALLGLDENEFVRSTNATFKLGIEFVNWTRIGHSYIHSFGNFGPSMEGVSFHHFWLQQHQAGYPFDLSEFSLEAIAAYQGKFMRSIPGAKNSPLGQIAYAFQFDAIL